MNFTYDYGVFNTTMEWENDEHPAYADDNSSIVESVTGVIRSNDHEDRCWTIANANKATSKSSVVFLKKCEPQRLIGRQMWNVMSGHILLADSNDPKTPSMNHKWRSFVGIPYMGIGQKLRTRRVYDISMGGHQLLADKVDFIDMEMDHMNNVYSPSSPGTPDDSPNSSPGSPGSPESQSSPDSENEREWPECMFIGSEDWTGGVSQMFQMPGHEHYLSCSVFDKNDAAEFFGKDPATAVYPDCLFLATTELANAWNMMIRSPGHEVFQAQGCNALSYEFLMSLA